MKPKKGLLKTLKISKLSIKRRVFLGIPVPAPLSQEINSFIKPGGNTGKVRWVPHWNYHLTTCFIGDTPQRKIPEILKKTKEITANHHAFTLRYDSLDFAPPKRPYMIWAKYKKNDAFSTLSKDLLEVLKPGKELKYEPIPHITLARFKKLKYHERPNLEKESKAGDIQVKELVLWESILTETGALYNALESISLGNK